MNLHTLQELYEYTEYDEIKVIGKDMEREGRPYHILGLLRKGRQATLFVLELSERQEQRDPDHEKTRREQMRNSIQSGRNPSFFMKIRSLRWEGEQYEVSGACSGCQHDGFSEEYMILIKMMQAGWRLPKESPFLSAPWEELAVTRIELRDEMEQLPEWSDDMWVSFDTIPEEGILELPVILETGKAGEIGFSLQNESDVTCYINRVYMMDVWAEEESRFEDPVFRERMLQHMAEAELEKMKEQLFESLAEICPKGLCFPVIEYECTGNVSLQFYEREYLDTSEKPKKGSAAALIMHTKPDTETGSHGLKLRACLIQSPMEETTKRIEAELFSYTEVIQRKIEKLEFRDISV